MSVQIVKFIVSDEEVAGEGISGDPKRRPVKLFNMEGDLVAEFDSHERKAECDFLLVGGLLS